VSPLRPCFFIVLLILVPNMAHADDCSKPGWYTFGFDSIRNTLRRVGLDENLIHSIDGIRRSSDGSSLYLLIPKKAIVVLSCNSTVDVFDTASRYFDTINTANTVYEFLVHRYNFSINQVNGTVGTKPPCAYQRAGIATPSGVFFADHVGHGMGIFKSSEPRNQLFFLPPAESSIYCMSEFHNQLCIVYMNRATRKFSGILLRQGSHGTMEIVMRFATPFPPRSGHYYVADIDVERKVLLLVDCVDWPLFWPFVSKAYEYNFATNSTRCLGAAKDYNFFLQCDILRKVMHDCK